MGGHTCAFLHSHDFLMFFFFLLLYIVPRFLCFPFPLLLLNLFQLRTLNKERDGWSQNGVGDVERWLQCDESMSGGK